MPFTLNIRPEAAKLWVVFGDGWQSRSVQNYNVQDGIQLLVLMSEREDVFRMTASFDLRDRCDVWDFFTSMHIRPFQIQVQSSTAIRSLNLSSRWCAIRSGKHADFIRVDLSNEFRLDRRGYISSGAFRFHVAGAEKADRSLQTLNKARDAWWFRNGDGRWALLVERLLPGIPEDVLKRIRGFVTL